MIALEEMDLVAPDEIEKVEERALHLPNVDVPESPVEPNTELTDEVYQALERFHGTVYVLLVRQFRTLKDHYLSFRRMLLQLDGVQLTPESAVSLRKSVEPLNQVVSDLSRRFEAASEIFEGDAAAIVQDMALIVSRMRAGVRAIVEACEQAIPAGNRAFRRAQRRKKRLPASHLPKVPITDPRPKPKR